MDTIILAAGRNERLRGIVPSYLKPLMLVNGEPLLVSQLKLLQSGRRTVVVSPSNANLICEVLRDNGLLNANTNIVVQPDAVGPLDAVWRALPHCSSEQFTLLCGDNIIPAPDLIGTREAAQGEVGALCIKKEALAKRASRFTRVLERGTVNEGQFADREAEINDRWEDGAYRIWVGPVVVNTEVFRRTAAMVFEAVGNSALISDVLRCIEGLVTCEGDCSDIGTPEALPQ